MNLFDRLIKHIIKEYVAKQVRQGPFHAKNITKMYQVIRDACEKEFTEDNDPTLDGFLLERFELTQSQYYNKHSNEY